MNLIYRREPDLTLWSTSLFQKILSESKRHCWYIAFSNANVTYCNYYISHIEQPNKCWSTSDLQNFRLFLFPCQLLSISCLACSTAVFWCSDVIENYMLCNFEILQSTASRCLSNGSGLLMIPLGYVQAVVRLWSTECYSIIKNVYNLGVW